MQTTTEDKIIEVTDAIQQLLLEKNRRYGNSALQPMKIFNRFSVENSILIRLDDKLSRIKNSDELRVNDICDLIGYLNLLLVAKGTTEQDILKLID